MDYRSLVASGPALSSLSADVLLLVLTPEQSRTGHAALDSLIAEALKAGGFNGPVMVECCKIGATAAETTANAKANRDFLTHVLAGV